MSYPNPDNYTIGKGKILLKIEGESAFRELGNAPDFKIMNEVERRQHYSSIEQIKKQDAEFIIQHKASCQFTLDELKPENDALFALSDDPSDVAQSSGNVTDEEVVAAHDKWVPFAFNKVSSVVVQDDGDSTTYVLGTDYQLNTEEGLIMALSSGSIGDTDTLHVDYSYAAETRERVSAGTREGIYGHLLFIGNPPKGRKKTVKGYVSLSPTGEKSYIGDDVATMQFQGEFLEHADYTGVYDEYDRGVVS